MRTGLLWLKKEGALGSSSRASTWLMGDTVSTANAWDAIG